MRVRLLAVVAVVLAVVLAGCSSGSGSTGDADDPARDLTAPSAGGRLPDVRLDALDGDRALDLGSLQGPTVVNLWAHWCGPCKEELPIYTEFAERHGDRVDVVGIATEETSFDDARVLARRLGVTYPLYADPDDALRAIALPKIVLVDADGEIAFEQYVEIDDLAQLEDLVRDHLGVRL